MRRRGWEGVAWLLLRPGGRERRRRCSTGYKGFIGSPDSSPEE